MTITHLHIKLSSIHRNRETPVIQGLKLHKLVASTKITVTKTALTKLRGCRPKDRIPSPIECPGNECFF